MKKGDFIWAGLFLGFCVILAIPSTREAFINFTSTYKLLGGFLKFSVLATMGELLARRVDKGEWTFPSFFVTRGIVWGLLGMVITMIFGIYSAGVINLQVSGIFPFEGVSLAFAFFTAALMNLTFAPTFINISSRKRHPNL